jgi:hypothetical protein
MAIYNLEEFQILVKATRWHYLNERRTFKHLDKLNWSDEEFTIMLSSLTVKDFKKSFQNNKVNDYPGLDYVDADQFVIHWDMDEHVRKDRASDSTMELSMKIAIIRDTLGNLSGIVDFHLSGSVD